MEKDLLKELRRNYKIQLNDISSKKDLLTRLFNQREEIEENPVVQQYLALNKCIEVLKKDIIDNEKNIKEQIINQYYEICMSSSENNRLYVYVDDVYDNNENFCSYYFDVITALPKEVVISEVDEFEKNNTVIPLDLYIKNSELLANGFDCQGSNLSISDIIKTIQRDFIMNSLDMGYDKAIQKVLTKTKK